MLTLARSRLSRTGCRVFRAAREGLVPGLAAKLKEVYGYFEKLAGSYSVWVVGFSGGKDSTLLLHLVTEYLCEASRSRAALPEKVIVVYNDTLVELPPVHSWATNTLKAWESFVKKELGGVVHAGYTITRPRIVDTFYWRLFTRGYPAPNYKFRWCTELFKIQPARRFFENELLSLLEPGTEAALLVGSRDDESTTRKQNNMRRARAACPVAGCFEATLLSTDYPRVVKAAPLRFWTEEMVWGFISLFEPPWSREERTSYSRLRSLYGCNGAGSCIHGGKRGRPRHGCWMCTVTKRHPGFKVVLSLYGSGARRWAEALWHVRMLYRLLSDAKELRLRKTIGYTSLGPLKADARGLLYSIIGYIADYAPGNLSRELLYGLYEEYNNRELRLSEPVRYNIYTIFYKIARENPDQTYKLVNIIEKAVGVRGNTLGMSEFNINTLQEWATNEPKQLFKKIINKIDNKELKNSIIQIAKKLENLINIELTT